MTRAAAPLAALALAALLAACGGTPTGVDLPGGQVGGTSGVGTDAQLVGRWSRTIFFSGPDGSVRSSQTIWDFDANRAFLRRVVAREHTAGLVDTVASSGTWRTEAPATLVLRYTMPPSSVDVRFAYRVDGDTLLVLADQGYGREAR
ncbi:MAG TPA: hypothetical protein VFY16_10540 [Gemmatimonadaceae bacterium]|nr:hypothetical protein [Gemmatimonadaceae bacterium]